MATAASGSKRRDGGVMIKPTINGNHNETSMKSEQSEDHNLHPHFTFGFAVALRWKVPHAR